MNVQYSLYELEPFKIKEGVHYSNTGVLLKFEETSFGLYHPIETLGDVSISDFLHAPDAHLKLLEKIKEQSVSVSDIDLSTFDKRSVKSYYSSFSVLHLLENEKNISDMGFKTAKLKMKSLKEMDIEIEKIKPLPFQFIFDFNGREERVAFESLSDKTKDFLSERVSYLEDPYLQKQKLDFVNLASDFIDYGDQGDFQVVKPTGFSHENLFKSPQTAVVTSYLDHPLGQMMSAKWACEKSIENECGLFSHTYYKKNKYSDLFQEKSIIRLDIMPAFLDLLQKEEWKRLL